MIETILVISVIFNSICIWYIVQLLRRFLDISENLENFFEVLKEYETHVDVVYNLERFYGDSTLQNLLRHTKDIVKESNLIRELYDIDFENTEDENTEDEDNEEEKIEDEDNE